MLSMNREHARKRVQFRDWLKGMYLNKTVDNEFLYHAFKIAKEDGLSDRDTIAEPSLIEELKHRFDQVIDLQESFGLPEQKVTRKLLEQSQALGLIILEPTESKLRKRNLALLISIFYGSQDNRYAWLALHTGRKNSYYSRLFAPHNKYAITFGDRLAADIERLFLLDRGTLDTENEEVAKETLVRSEARIKAQDIPFGIELLSADEEKKPPRFASHSSNKTVTVAPHARSKPNEEPRYVAIPHLSAKFAAGSGASNNRADISSKNDKLFDAGWVESLNVSAKELVIFDVVGNSMAPRIQDGDAVLVHADQKVLVDDAIYVLSKNDQFFLKRVRLNPIGGLTLVSDNPAPDYPDIPVAEEDIKKLSIIGRVLWVGGAV